ncbi:MAG: hypothetical protein ABWY78_12790 [Microvirga sp.]
MSGLIPAWPLRPSSARWANQEFHGGLLRLAMSHPANLDHRHPVLPEMIDPEAGTFLVNMPLGPERHALIWRTRDV